MASVTVVFGVVLILMGLGGYFGSGMVSITAMIPAFIGLPILLCGLIAKNEKFRMHAIHAAVLLGLIGFGGSVPGVVKLIKWAGGTEPGRPFAVIMQSVMAALMLVYVVLCVRSFINARRQRKA